MVMKSLEDFRRERYMEVAEFATFLHISPRTYYRLLKRDPGIRPRTMRKIAARLEVAPPAIAEFFPPPSPALLTQLSERLDQAEAHGAVIFDVDQGEPTEERITVPALITGA